MGNRYAGLQQAACNFHQAPRQAVFDSSPSLSTGLAIATDERQWTIFAAIAKRFHIRYDCPS
jgi:hypothetical protein